MSGLCLDCDVGNNPHGAAASMLTEQPNADSTPWQRCCAANAQPDRDRHVMNTAKHVHLPKACHALGQGHQVAVSLSASSHLLTKQHRVMISLRIARSLCRS